MQSAFPATLTCSLRDYTALEAKDYLQRLWRLQRHFHQLIYIESTVLTAFVYVCVCVFSRLRPRWATFFVVSRRHSVHPAARLAVSIVMSQPHAEGLTPFDFRMFILRQAKLSKSWAACAIEKNA